MSYHDDLSELSIAATCYGGEVFQFVGRARDYRQASFKQLVDGLVGGLRGQAIRAGFDPAKAQDIRWGVHQTKSGPAVYCVGWYREQGKE